MRAFVGALVYAALVAAVAVKASPQHPVAAATALFAVGMGVLAWALLAGLRVLAAPVAPTTPGMASSHPDHPFRSPGAVPSAPTPPPPANRPPQDRPPPRSSSWVGFVEAVAPVCGFGVARAARRAGSPLSDSALVGVAAVVVCALVGFVVHNIATSVTPPRK